MTTKPNQLPQRAAPTILSCIGSETWLGEVKKVIPDYLTPELMLRVARSVATDPKFAQCTPQSFLIALLKCARAGLVPDGRNAHLIPFGKEVNVIFDWKGLVAMAKRNGVEVTSKIVCEDDEFEVLEDDGTGLTKVYHKVDYLKARGEVVAVYSRAKTRGGETDYEIMTAEECEEIKEHFSRKDSKGNFSLMWRETPTEAYRKTVIRRHSKRWDLDPETRAVIYSDDDTAVEVASRVQPVTQRPLFNAASKHQLEDAAAVDGETQQAAAPATAPAEEVKREVNRLPDEAAEPAPEPEAGAPTEPPTAEPTEQGAKYLKAVRQLCRAGKFPESSLLDLLATIGQGEFGSLEDIALSNSPVLQWVTTNWTAKILPKLKELQSARSKRTESEMPNPLPLP